MLTDVSARRYVEMSQMSCEDPYDTTFTFNSLQQSNVYPSESRARGRHASPPDTDRRRRRRHRLRRHRRLDRLSRLHHKVPACGPVRIRVVTSLNLCTVRVLVADR